MCPSRSGVIAVFCVLSACLETTADTAADSVMIVGVQDVTSDTRDPSDTGVVSPEVDSGPDVRPVLRSDLVAHEWGTFTSVQGSDGVSLAGLHHEDEALPLWVHRRNLTDRNNYYFEELPEEPLQQLETPVIYFYAPRRMDVRVVVDFPDGVVSQWYPDASTFAPPLYALTEVGQGQMTWDVTLDPAIDPATWPPVSPDEIWAPSRNVASTPLEAVTPNGIEREGFIFYRGLGSFDLPVRVTAPSDERVVIDNGGEEGLAAVVVLVSTPEGGAVLEVGGLAAGEARAVDVPLARPGRAAFEAEARRVLFEAIVATGLHADEAQAMVDTWTRSWFGNVGLRILYMVPRAWTDRLLPIVIEPTPDELVRTLVGRIEVLTPGVEAETEAALAALPTSPEWGELEALVDRLGRFAEPRIRRALVRDTGIAARGAVALEAAHARP